MVIAIFLASTATGLKTWVAVIICGLVQVASRKHTLYNRLMIKSFVHKGLEAFFRSGSKKGIQPHHASRLRLQLTMLDKARQIKDMSAPGWRLHQLSNGHWSVWVNGNWRMTFYFEGEDAILVDYQDYH